MIKNKLKEIRMKEYMIESKSEFARMLNVPVQTYIKWENEEEKLLNDLMENMNEEQKFKFAKYEAVKKLLEN